MSAIQKVAIIGLGLIGSSIARAIKPTGYYTVVGYDNNADYRTTAGNLNFCHTVADTLVKSIENADIVILATPVQTYVPIMSEIANNLKAGAIVTDVGSVKEYVCDALRPHIPDSVHFIPAHPIAGTENSGPEAGFAGLFENRYNIICPLPDTPAAAVDTLLLLWQRCGAITETMSPYHHDRVLAVTSHIPHLLAYTLVGTANRLEHHYAQGKITDTIEKTEIMKFSAGGFRDSTRVAASDPTMWRDIFLTNKDAILEVVEAFEKDLSTLKQAITEQDGDALYDWCDKTRSIRQGIIDMGQAGHFDPTETTPSILPYGGGD